MMTAAIPLEVLTRRARAAEQPAGKPGCGQIWNANLHGDFDLSEPSPPAIFGLPARGAAATLEIYFRLTTRSLVVC
jgi:hypothetical protein